MAKTVKKPAKKTAESVKKSTKPAPVKVKAAKSDNTESWINPLGGFGDILMLSGVLKLVNDANPQKKFNIVRRAKYANILRGHPAIKELGYPPKDAKIIDTNYWDTEGYSLGKNRAFQLLAQKLGLKTPVEEKLYLPGKLEDDPVLDKIIPWKKKNVIISPSTDSPRKMMHPMAWHNIVERLNSEGVLVIQVGKMQDLHIKGAYSLLNLTSPRQLIALIRKCNFVVTSDNFIMHAAHLVQKPAVVVWGPTKSSVYGYPEHIHIQAPLEHCQQRDECIGPRLSQNYPTQCPLKQDQCLNKIPPEKIMNAIFTLL
jgi:ADP-heptose:LPS heptosyltransferase